MPVQTLPDETGPAVREAEAWRALQRLVATSDDPALWAVAPKLAISFTGVDAGRRGRWSGSVAAAARAVRGGTGPRIDLLGDTAYVSSSVGQRRSLTPLLAAPTGRAPLRRSLPRVDAGGLMGAPRARARLARALRQWSVAHGDADPEDPAALLLAAALTQRRAARWLRTAPPDRIVVATQHNPAVRAVLLAAREAGVPTAYLPHAPAAATPWYDDLPVDRALLRGDGECSYYGSLGARGPQVAAVGDPAITGPTASARVDAAAPVLWATSPHPPVLLAAVVELLASSGLPVEVAPHPRADRRLLRRLCPPGWSWNEAASTAARLASGPLRCLVQHRSGMGLEAVLAGVPVVELCAPGRVPPYRYLADLATVVRTTEELVEAVRSAEPVAGSLVARWCAATGEQARARAVAEIEATVAGPVTLDGWRSAPGGREAGP